MEALNEVGRWFAVAFITPAEVVMAVLLIATGFVIGVYAGGFVRRALSRYATDKQADVIRLSDVFASRFEHESWDPCEIQTRPGVDELATREEHVLRLLISNGGRMRQADLIAETGWSQAKVSRLLQRMEEQGDVTRVHVGRNNLIVLGNFRAPATAEG